MDNNRIFEATIIDDRFHKGFAIILLEAENFREAIQILEDRFKQEDMQLTLFEEE